LYSSDGSKDGGRREAAARSDLPLPILIFRSGSDTGTRSRFLSRTLRALAGVAMR